jgi:hypothetical protein
VAALAPDKEPMVGVGATASSSATTTSSSVDFRPSENVFISSPFNCLYLMAQTFLVQQTYASLAVPKHRQSIWTQFLSVMPHNM